MLLLRSLAGVACAALLVSSTRSFAWDSVCYQFNNPDAPVVSLTYATVVSGSRGCEGIEAARGRLRDPVKKVDEHRQIFAFAVNRAGLPPAVLETYALTELTKKGSVAGKNNVPTPTVAPGAGPWRYIDALYFSAVKRYFSIDEFAQLPDVSYGLWDWANGNESCPLPVAAPFNDARDCHAFAKHMGATNANHWPPQADMWFDHYHQLALDSASQCLVNRALVWEQVPTLVNGETQAAVDGRMSENWKACEVESLIYEAIAQHFLQDAWSAGHMWEHWGSPDINDFTTFRGTTGTAGDLAWNALDPSVQKVLIAQTVGVVVGTIHGIDPPFIDWPFLPFPKDPLGYPDVSVTAHEWPANYDNNYGPQPPGPGFNVVGDLSLHDLPANFPDKPTHLEVTGNATLPYNPNMALFHQADKLAECTSGSVAEVYAALMDPDARFAPVLGLPSNGPLSQFAFNRDACRGPVVTNKAFAEGMISTDTSAGTGRPQIYQTRLLATWALPKAAAFGPTPSWLSYRLTRDYKRLYDRANYLAERAPYGTNLAKNPGVLLQARPNSAYLTPAPLAAISDPPAQNGKLPLSNDPSTHAGALSLTFHRSRAADFCSNPATLSEADFLGDLIRRTRRLPDTNPQQHLARETAVQACAEWVAPFVWNKDSWNTSDPDWNKHHYDMAPLCSYLPEYPHRIWVETGRGTYYSLGDGTELVGDRAAYPRRGSGNAVVGYDQSTAYVGGQPNATSEELARLMCGAPLVADNAGGFRISGKITGLHPDAAVGLFLRSSESPPLSRDTKVWTMDGWRPLFRFMGRTAAENPWIDDEDRTLVRLIAADDYNYVAVSLDLDADYTAREGLIAYRDPPDDNTQPLHHALFAIHGFSHGLGQTHGGGADGSDYYFNNPRHSLPPNGTYVLQPLTPTSGLQQCEFDPATQTVTLDATHPELWDVNFTATCQPTHALSLTINGNGNVDVGPAGLFCANTGPDALPVQQCTYRFLGEVTLKVRGGATISSWGGACAGSGSTCTVTLDQAKSVTANFH